MRKTSVLYILSSYPQISQTYIKTELEALQDDYDLTLVSRKSPNLAYENHLPYHNLREEGHILELIEQIKPDVIHTHWLNQLDFVGPLAKLAGIPFTVRSHSFDTSPLRTKNQRLRIWGFLKRKKTYFRQVAQIKKNLQWVNHELCLGVLAFPYVRPYLEAHGADSKKIVDCYPVVDYRRFHDRSPNGEAVMNIGAAIPKKRMEDFIRLGARVPEKRFNLYALGYDVRELETLNEAAGNPVHFHSPVEPKQMPREYKKHQWLVYTSDFRPASVGWPMAVAEAQASGVGVCIPNIRPDMAQYLGGAGFLYRSIGEVVDLVKRPVPEEIREAGFQQAQKSDIRRHKRLLTGLWPKSGQREIREAA